MCFGGVIGECGVDGGLVGDGCFCFCSCICFGLVIGGIGVICSIGGIVEFGC